MCYYCLNLCSLNAWTMVTDKRSLWEKYTLLIKTIFLKNKTYIEYFKICSQTNTIFFFETLLLKVSSINRRRMSTFGSTRKAYCLSWNRISVSTVVEACLPSEFLIIFTYCFYLYTRNYILINKPRNIKKYT